MIINLLTVGKLKTEYEAAARMYEKRLSGRIKLTVKELPEAFLPQNPSDSDIKKAVDTEAKAFAAFLTKGMNVALCVEGKPLSSEDFAEVLRNGHVNFFIGSSHGLAESVKKAADLRLSLSQMTLPHALARVFLLEQIYRGIMINSGSKYHK
jgi:23S rRNA (pseudouridine1915-N3)-methyltransferase